MRVLLHRPLLVAIAVALTVPCALARADDPAERLRKLADRELEKPIVSVMDKTSVAPSGDRHDYYALSPYHWPNPKSADGLPYVFRDGQVNPAANTDAYDRVSYFQMGDAVARLAAGFDATGDERYARGAAEWLRVWFVDPATRMNPNLEYSQCIPGQKQGLPIGIIRGMTLIDVARAARLLEPTELWTTADRESLATWMGEYLDWVTTSELGKAEAKGANNHGSWHSAQVAALALFVGDPDLAREAVSVARDQRLPRQIARDGRQPLESLRTKSWDYSVMNLEAFVVLADVGSAVGVDLWNYKTGDGRGLETVFRYLAPFAAGEKPWPGKQIRDFDPTLLAPLAERARRAWPSADFLSNIELNDSADANRFVSRRLLAVSLAPGKDSAE